MATRLANREACRKEPQKIGKSICICQNHNRSGTPRATPPPAARGPSHALPKAQAHRAPPREAPREERVDAGRYVLARTLTFAIIALVLLGVLCGGAASQDQLEALHEHIILAMCVRMVSM